MVPVETIAMIRLNILLLFLVAIEPFLFYLLTSSSIETSIWQWSSSYYGLDIAGMNFILAFFAHILTREEKKLIPAEQIHRFRVSRTGFLSVGMLFAISAIPSDVLWTVSVLTLPLRIFFWLLTVPVIWASRTIGKQA